LGVALRANNSYTRALESFTLALSLNHTIVRPGALMFVWSITAIMAVNKTARNRFRFKS
jgi:hypothetical protein